MFITAAYGTKGEMLWRKVIVDPDEGRVTFRRCHAPNRFLAWGVEDEYTCSLSELLGVCWSGAKGLGLSLEIVTPAGRARLPRTARGFDAVHAAILGGLSPTARLRWYQYPSGQFLIVLPMIFAGAWFGLALLAGAPDRAAAIGFVLVSPLLVIPIATWFRGRPIC